MSYISALQLSTLPMNEAKLDYYARICDKKDIRVVVLGEYVLNSFFKELETMPKNMIKAQSVHKINIVKSICKKYNLTIVAPLVRVVGGKIVKSILKASPNSLRYFKQNFFINYPHWNEEKFYFSQDEKYSLATFSQDGIKYAIVMGFELHFDYVWQQIDKKKIDVVLLPSVSTFESKDRWDELLRMRSFTHNVYILRVNRIGSFKQDDGDWHFYGHSSLTNPHGELEECLNDEEAMLVVEVDKKKIKEARKVWGWQKTLHNKGLL